MFHRSRSLPSRPARSSGALSRKLLLLLASVVVLLSSSLNASDVPRLYVFANADMRANALEKELEAHLPGVDVTVFSRIREFETALEDKPEATLARRPVLESLRLNAELQGLLGGKPTERFVLISANTQVSPADLGGKTLGVVNIMGRREMDDFVRDLLGGVAPKLKHVTHERDLLALLQFNAAAAIVTSEAWARRLSEKSEMNLRTTPLQKEVGLPAVAFGSPNARNVVLAKIKAAGPAFNQLLGVNQWR